MEPEWVGGGTDETYNTTAFGATTLSVFRTMFGSYSYLVSGKGRSTKVGNVGDLEAAKAAALEMVKARVRE